MFRAGEEVNHLPFGVSPRIGSAGAPNSGFVTGEPGYCLFQLPLDGRVTNLKLKTRVIGALVFHQKGGTPRHPDSYFIWAGMMVMGCAFFYLIYTSDIDPVRRVQ